MRLHLAAVAALLVLSNVATAQSAGERVLAGDRERAARNGASALRQYEAALVLEPRRYDALWKASRDAVELGEAQQGPEQAALFRRAEQYARRAIDANPRDAEGHFALARALGRTALAAGVRERVQYAADVRKHALDALSFNPRHAGALHVMGVWHAEVMRLNSIQRLLAKRFLGGAVFGTASWKEATRYLESAVAAEPERVVHRAELAEVYLDMGDRGKARAQWEAVIRGAPQDPDGARYRRQAEAALTAMR